MAHAATVWLLNAAGQPVLSQQSPNRSRTHQFTLELAHLPAGTYVVRLAAGGQTYVRKLLKV